MGHSVGAHLVAALFSNFINTLSYEEQALIKTVFLSCGLYDLTPLIQTIINQGLKLTEDTARLLSPQHMNIISPVHVGFHVIAAENESPALLEQAQAFYDKLKKNKINAKYTLLKDEDHFSAIEKIVDENFEVTQLVIKATAQVWFVESKRGFKKVPLK